MSDARANIVLRAATPDDIPFIRACEQRPGYDQYIGTWSEDVHRASMADEAFHYFLACEVGEPRGFAILHQSPMHLQNLYLKRTAMYEMGRGYGRALFTALHDWIFANTDTHRFWLEVAENNAHAKHLYESLGFVVEGIVREGWPGRQGGRASAIQMSLIKPDWLARRR